MDLDCKKIGIFTLTDALNYGAFYQMYGLQQYLKDANGDVVVYSPSLSMVGELKKYFAFSFKRMLRKALLRKAYNIDGKSVVIRNYRGEELDIAIFGSDEIWNVDNKSFENSSLFFGCNVRAKLKIAYAPSVGYAQKSSFDKILDFRDGLRSLDKILYRDSLTKEVVFEQTGIIAQRVVDPTILYDKWEKHFSSKRRLSYEKYIVYYSYISDPPFLDVMKEFAEHQGYSIISAGYNVHNWADENLVLGPWDFLSLLKHAECIFTTTFHGTIMSTLLEKIVFFSPSGQKVRDFAKLCGIENNQIDSTSQLDSLVEIVRTFSIEEILKTKNKLKANSREILKGSIFKNE